MFISNLFASTSAAAKVIGSINNFWYSWLNLTDIGEVVPIPTDKFGTTFIFTTSPSNKLCVVVSAAATFVKTVVVTFSTSPVTCLLLDFKKYKSELIPELVPLVKKNKPSLVLPIPTLVVTNPT